MEFWQSSPEEVEAVLDRKYETERAAYLRAGLIAATIVNVNRKKGARLTRASDFIREPRKAEDYMSVEEAATYMDTWVSSVNQQPKAEKK
jgi:hypothetical protein